MKSFCDIILWPDISISQDFGPQPCKSIPVGATSFIRCIWDRGSSSSALWTRLLPLGSEDLTARFGLILISLDTGTAFRLDVIFQAVSIEAQLICTSNGPRPASVITAHRVGSFKELKSTTSCSTAPRIYLARRYYGRNRSIDLCDFSHFPENTSSYPKQSWTIYSQNHYSLQAERCLELYTRLET